MNGQRRSGLLATTLRDFFESVYVPYIADQTRLSTSRSYQNVWKRYLEPRCGLWWLQDVRTCEVQRLLYDIAANHEIGRKTLARIKAVLSGLFTCARRQGFFDGANPVTGVAVPKAPVGGETYAYSLEEVMKIITSLPQPASTIAAVAAFTGLRRSEIQGLQWQEYLGSELRVTRSIRLGYIEEPKTRKSKAPVPVIEPLRRMLETYRRSRGNPTQGPMFPNAEGEPMCLNNLTNRVVQPRFEFCTTCGRSRETHERDHQFERDEERRLWHGWHSFRRGLATNLYRLGVPDKTIQAILRHSNLNTTMNVYVKSVDKDSAAAMRKLERALRPQLMRRRNTMSSRRHADTRSR